MQDVAGQDGAAPGEGVDLCTHGAAGDAAENGVELQAHGECRGVPAARDEGAEVAGFGLLVIEVLGLGVELFGEGDEAIAVHGVGGGGEDLADAEVLVEERGEWVVRHGSACGAGPGAGGDGECIADAEAEESGAEGQEQGVQGAGEVEGEPAADDRDEHADDRGGEGQRHAACALRGEIERHAEAEETVEGADGAEIGAAGFKHGRVGVEQAEPGFGEGGDGEADAFGEEEGEDGAGPGGTEGTGRLPGAEISTDEGDEGCAEAENERDEEVFQAGAGAVAGDGGGAICAAFSGGAGSPDHRRGEGDDEVGLDGHEGGGDADAQDAPERREAQGDQAKAEEGAAALDIEEHREAAGHVVEQHGEAAAGDAHSGDGADAEDEAGERGIRRTTPPQVTRPGVSILPVPRMTLARPLESQARTAPPKTTLEYWMAAARAGPSPPMAR